MQTGCPDCPGPVQLTEQNHGEGWGQEGCFACHPKVKLHLATRNPALDLELIRDLVDRDGVHACSTCHGGNGA